MTDREMLELAAKAASWGTGPWVWSEKAGGFIYRVNGDRVIWNPLTDDGDALRLAVRLGLLIDTQYNNGVGVGSASFEEVWESAAVDPLAATRRAIVRAAAEIGKGMK